MLYNANECNLCLLCKLKQEDSVSWQTDYGEKPVWNGSQVLSVSGFTAAQMRDRYLEGSESLQETLRSDSGVRYLQRGVEPDVVSQPHSEPISRESQHVGDLTHLPGFKTSGESIQMVKVRLDWSKCNKLKSCNWTTHTFKTIDTFSC